MNLRKLYAFTVVANMGSFVKAAEYLHFSQPALSKQIASFEQELGVRLLERNTHGVTLTEAGSVLLAGADTVFQAVKGLENAVIDAGKREDSKLNVCHGVFHFSSLHSFHKVFGEKNPGLRVSAIDHALDENIADLLDGRLDILIIRSFEMPRNLCGNRLTFQYIKEAKLQFCVHKDHPLAKLKNPALEDMAGYALIFMRHILKNGGDLQKDVAAKTRMHIPDGLPAKHESFMQMLFDDRHVGLYEKDTVQPPGDAYQVFDVAGCEMPFYVTAIWNVKNNNPLIHLYVNEISNYMSAN